MKKKNAVAEYGWNEGLLVFHRDPLRAEAYENPLESGPVFAVGDTEKGTRHICVRRNRLNERGSRL